MQHEELLEECQTRGLPTDALPGAKGDYRNRPQMILMIREDVNRRLMESARIRREENPTAARPTGGSTSQRRKSPDGLQHMDWEQDPAASAAHGSG